MTHRPAGFAAGKNWYSLVRLIEQHPDPVKIELLTDLNYKPFRSAGTIVYLITRSMINNGQRENGLVLAVNFLPKKV